MASGTVHQINVAATGGVPKLAIESTRIEIDHVAGDVQRHLKFHGGPTRAVCLYSLERLMALRGEGHDISPGVTGENLTLCGIDWDGISPGVRLAIGDEVELEITAYTVPCQQIAPYFAGRDFKRMSQPDFPGWARVYAKVIRTGIVRRGDPAAVIRAIASDQLFE